MTQPPGPPPPSGPLPPGFDDPPPPSGNRSSALIVIAILGVLALVAAAVGIYALVTDSDGSDVDDRSRTTGRTTSAAPTDEPTERPSDLPSGFPTELPSDFPSGFPTELPSDFPSDFPTEFPSLPTNGGPSENAYVDIASAAVAAIRAGDCGGARRYLTDTYSEAASNASLCRGFQLDALQDDDLGKHDILFFGTYGAAVEFDGGRTFVSLVAQTSGPPQIDALIAY